MHKSGKTPGGKQRWECRFSGGETKGPSCYKTTDPTAAGVRNQRGDTTPAGRPAVFKRTFKDAKRFIITAAQNGTPVHNKFWHALRTYAKVMKAEMLVIPLRYKNPTSRWTKSQENADYWVTAVQPYLFNVRTSLNANVMVLGDVKTQPTASSPLTGFEAISSGESCIIGHTKLQMKTVPAPSHKLPKILTTTGACTRANYTDSKAGKMGEFHHTLGAVIVEVVNSKVFHLRHINAHKLTGEFTDIDKTFSPTGVRIAEPALALIMGDTHVDFIDPAVERATFSQRGLVDTLRPGVLVWHDLLDAYAVNPHHKGNPFNALAKRNTGRDDIAAEVRRAIAFVDKHTPHGRASVIVSSNHDDMLSRWVVGNDWKLDPTNAVFYLRTALELAENTSMGSGGTSYPNPFAYWVKKMATSRVRTLRRTESFTLGRVELSMHGDVGPHGSRGSVRNLRRIGVRSVIGHSHSPGIDEGCYQVGTSTSLRLEYNFGPSGWLNTHCILHADGKRQLINIINGEWRL